MTTDKLKKLEENLFTLEIIKDSYTVDDIICDKVDEWGLRYGLFESIQIIKDFVNAIKNEKS